QRAGAATLPRPGHYHARGPRGPAAGIGRHDRAPRAPRLPGSAGRPARSGLRARPHVHVAVLDLWLPPAAGRHYRAAGLDLPRAGAAGRVLAAGRADLDLAAGGRADGPGARRPGQPTGPTTLPNRHDYLTGLGTA